jgi:two-component system NtrC family sensor kinase
MHLPNISKARSFADIRIHHSRLIKYIYGFHMSELIHKEDLVSYISNVSLFNKVDASVLNHLADVTSINSFEADERIITKGDEGNAMYLILSGKCKVHDEEHQVAELKKGEFFGELSLLDSEPRSMSVSTLEPSVLGSISRNDFYEVLMQFPEMTKDMISVINKRLRNQNDVLVREFRGREEQLQEQVRERTLELQQKNALLEEAMDNLKKSQQQLVQIEKLASLGQLIAGIAHEIQNPLNFVNNFSQLSKELIQEIREVSSEEERLEIMEDLEKNMEKINHHGRRADSIVKNMLEHSRAGAGEKQPTDINQLCREYVNLAYQGMRANNQEFNCEIKLDLDENIPVIKAVSQDISRVLLNIINNALYAINEQSRKNISGYRPLFELKTAGEKEVVLITISDNGTGIPDVIKAKVFEPFYTTKPTGQGTGLGLSLSFDIINSHGGEIRFDSHSDKGTAFFIRLPV